MRRSFDAFDFCLDEALIEIPGTIGIVNMCDASLGTAYEKKQADIDRRRSNQASFQLTFLGMNYTVRQKRSHPALFESDTNDFNVNKTYSSRFVDGSSLIERTGQR